MKKIMLFAMLGLFLQAPVTAEAQILKKLKKKIEKKAEKKIDETIDKSLEKKEGEVDAKKSDTVRKQNIAEKGIKNQSPNVFQKSTLVWAKYDFVPGDKVLFEDNLIGEENGEFPSRWDMVRGTTENAEFGGENIIMFRGGNPMVVPYLKNSQEDYLPDVFTVEFDLYVNHPNSFQVFFYDRKNQQAPSKSKALDVHYRGLNLTPARSNIPNNGNIKDTWAHIAIAYTKGKLKAYIDETRLINIPRLEFEPTGITLRAYSASDETKFYVKNIRIAKGGVKFYDRVMEDGKIVATGIRFDVNKATLKPESMGIINKVVKLMQDHPEIKFSIEGHTDSDGNDASNLKLSEARAKTVKNTMVKLGISADRLSTKGMGETAPIDMNDNPEGKANNRRVEFVKSNAKAILK